MKITELNIYPIKSLRPISLPTATLCAQGLEYDRRYILLTPGKNGDWRPMFVGLRPEMALFHCKLSTNSPASFVVEYHTPTPVIAPPTTSQKTSIKIPFEPEDVGKSKKMRFEMHTDPNYPSYRMGDEINIWFSECFGYEVILAYLGDGLGVRKEDEKAKSWLKAMEPTIPAQLSSVNFSDTAALLVTSEASLADLHPRLGPDAPAIIEKFRPNIVVDGLKAWDEDYWGALTLPSGLKIVLTSNCARCTSINVDLDKGKMGEGESGKLLKKMMRDRRVDVGNKWEPIFGRYGFPTAGGKIQVGDEVVVSKRNSEHSVWNGVMPRLAKFNDVAVV